MNIINKIKMNIVQHSHWYDIVAIMCVGLSILISFILIYCSSLEKYVAIGNLTGGVLTAGFSLAAFIAAYGNLRRQENRQNLLELESKLFRMIENHRRILENISINNHKGYDGVHYIYNELITSKPDDGLTVIEEEVSRGYVSKKEDFGYNRTVEMYESFWKKHQYQLGNYMRNSWHIFKMIDEAAVSDIDKKEYVDIYVAQFSLYEYVILFYNCYFREKRNIKFMNLADKYNIFEQLDDASVKNSYAQSCLKRIKNGKRVEPIYRIEAKDIVK